ncbi:MAG: hypothetical protein Kow0069_04150 [Promethearchaeota archaeon]
MRFDELGNWDLTPIAYNILAFLLKAGEPVTVRQVYDETSVTRYYIYEILEVLNSLGLVEVIHQKPRLFFSQVTNVKNLLKNLDDLLVSVEQAVERAQSPVDLLPYVELPSTEQLTFETVISSQDPLSTYELSKKLKTNQGVTRRALKQLVLKRLLVEVSDPSGGGTRFAPPAFEQIREVVLVRVRERINALKGVYRNVLDEVRELDVVDLMRFPLGDLKGRVSPATWRKILEALAKEREGKGKRKSSERSD